MQRGKGRQRRTKTIKRQVLRISKSAFMQRRQRRRRAVSLRKTPYVVQMRNTPEPDRGTWATYAAEARKGANGGRGLTSKQLAKLLDVDHSTIWRWENKNVRPVNADIVQRFATITGVDLDEALAAAGFKPGTPVVETPTREVDPDVEEIKSWGLPAKRTEELIDRLYRRREEERQRVMNELRFAAGAPDPKQKGREAS